MGASCVTACPILFERVGGPERVANIVSILHGKILNDDRISWMFKNTDWESWEKHEAS